MQVAGVLVIRRAWLSLSQAPSPRRTGRSRPAAWPHEPKQGHQRRGTRRWPLSAQKAVCVRGAEGRGARGLSSRLTAPDCVGPPRFDSGTVYPLQASPPPSRCRSACTVPPTGQHFTHAPVTPVQRPPPAPRLPAPRPRACPAAPALPSPSGPLPFQGPFLPAERPGPGPRCARHYCPCAVTTPLLGGADAGVSPRHRGTPLTVLRPPPRGTASAGTERKDAGALRPAGAQTGTEHDSTPTVVFVKSDHVTALLKTF